jgi:hypothetical protein
MYLAKADRPMTATEIRFQLGEFERSLAMKRLQEGMEKMLDEIIERVCATPIQFRFPRSKKKRIRKKWRKDPMNFRKLLDDGLEDIEIIGTERP